MNDYDLIPNDVPVENKRIYVDDICDANLLEMSKDLKRRLRRIEHIGPAKDIKIKNNKGDIKSHNWNCDCSDELAKLAIKCENEHSTEHSKEYCKNSARVLRMARDMRYATTFSRYQAIAISAEHTRSLADLAGDEVMVISRWEVHDNEKNCRECIDLMSCRASKCNHICHNFKKEMTTKGIKWALRETQELADLKKRIYRLSMDTDNICELMKVVLFNPYLKMKTGDRKSLMLRHIDVDDCSQCLYYTEKNPDWLKEHLNSKQ